jgi:hypothetical protein
VTQAKWVATCNVPRIGVLVVGTVQRARDRMLANFVASNALVQPLAGPAVVGRLNTTVPFVEPGTLFSDRLNQVDFRCRSYSIRQDASVNFDCTRAEYEPCDPPQHELAERLNSSSRRHPAGAVVQDECAIRLDNGSLGQGPKACRNVSTEEADSKPSPPSSFRPWPLTFAKRAR